MRKVRGAYEFDEGLIAIGADITLGVDDLAEGLAELDELLLGALPQEVTEVEHLRRRLHVPELRRPRCRHRAEIWSAKLGIGS